MSDRAGLLWIVFVYGLVIVLALLLVAGCDPGYAASRLKNVTHYTVNPDRVTPGGVEYQGGLDPARLDALTAEVARCLAGVQEPTTEQRVSLQCLPLPIRRDVDMRSFSVMLAPDWHPSCYDHEQVFACEVDPKLCEEKGLPDDPACPCSCRSATQDDRVIVVTPNLKLYGAELTRLVSGCNNVWFPPLNACAAVGVTP